MKNELHVVGVGPGSPELLTAEASAIIKNADCIVAAPRNAALAAGHDNVLLLGSFAETFERMNVELKKGSVAVLVSGDPGIYSLLPLIKKRFRAASLKVIPGIGSLQYLCCWESEGWEGAAILSGHGHPLSPARLLITADRNEKTIIFCGGDKSPKWVCETLQDNDMENLEVVVGERLSYPDQRVSRGTPGQLAGMDFDPLSVVLMRNCSPWTPPPGRLKDEAFIRSGVPMTKSEARSVILDKLDLTNGAVIWDIGAGTGSISVSAALMCPDGEVYAVDSDPLAVALAMENRKKFHCFNMKIQQGRCTEVINRLPRPTHIFIGGSGGELRDILAYAVSLGGGIRVVVSAVSLRTLGEAAHVMEGEGFSQFEAVQLAVSRSKVLGSSRIMAAQNPVTLCSASTRLREDEIKG